MKDPTREEMLTFLTDKSAFTWADEIDREEAVYWFATDYHGGQDSNLYSALSTTPYRPGLLMRGPNTIDSIMLYEELVEEFAA